MIKFKLVHNNGSLELPINPDELTDGSRNNNRTVDVVGIGEVSIPGKRKVKSWAIKSLLWADKIPRPPEYYKTAIEKLQNDNKPFRFIVEGLGINSRVIIDDFTCEYKAGEENDIYYRLVLLEAPVYGAKKVKIKLVQKVPEAGGAGTQPPKPADLKFGQVVYFLGGPHYNTSMDSVSVGGMRTKGNAKITNLALNNLRPVHLIGTAGGSNVYGWVDPGNIRGYESVPVTGPTGNVAHPPTTPVRAAPVNDNRNWEWYTVRQGDTLQSITSHYGATGDNEAMRLWDINKPHMMGNTIPIPGRMLRIPSHWRALYG